MNPRYPIYIISKGRHARPLTDDRWVVPVRPEVAA